MMYRKGQCILRVVSNNTRSLEKEKVLRSLSLMEQGRTMYDQSVGDDYDDSTMVLVQYTSNEG